MELFVPVLARSRGAAPELGDALLDEYLRFTAARLRPNSVTAQAFDLKVFFTVVGKRPLAVGTADVLAFIEAQRQPRRGGNVVRLSDGEQGLAASTIKRRLATVTSLFDYLIARGVCERQPVPRSITPRTRSLRGAPLVRAPKRLPRILAPGEAVALTNALRTQTGPGDGHAHAARRATALRSPRRAVHRYPARRPARVHLCGQGRSRTDRPGRSVVLHSPTRLPVPRAATRRRRRARVRGVEGPQPGSSAHGGGA